MTETQLLPCPFCGAPAHYLEHDGGILASCLSIWCGCHTITVDTKEEAARLWNRRDTTALDKLQIDLSIARLNHAAAQNRINQHLTDLDEMNHRCKAYADEVARLRALVASEAGWTEDNDSRR